MTRRAKAGTHQARRPWLWIAVTVVLSWTVLPLAIAPYGLYTLSELGETLLWQAIGVVGWPLALLGALAGLVMGGRTADPASVAFLLVYPAMLVLSIRALVGRRQPLWEWIVLQVIIAASFAAVWHGVRGGYTFMSG